MAIGFNATSTTGTSATLHCANLILAAVFKTTGFVAYTGPAAWWVQLHSADPGLNGMLNFCNGNPPVRAQMVGAAPLWAAPALGITSNRYDITFTAVTGVVTYTHFSLWDQQCTSITANSAGIGNFFASGTLTGDGTVGSDYVISAGQLQVKLAVAA